MSEFFDVSGLFLIKVSIIVNPNLFRFIKKCKIYLHYVNTQETIRQSIFQATNRKLKSFYNLRTQTPLIILVPG